MICNNCQAEARDLCICESSHPIVDLLSGTAGALKSINESDEIPGILKSAFCAVVLKHSMREVQKFEPKGELVIPGKFALEPGELVVKPVDFKGLLKIEP